MKKRVFGWWVLLAAVLLVVLLTIGGGWWFLRSQYGLAEATPSSSVFVTLITPSDGDEMTAGEFVPVMAQGIAPESIISAELFVDGQPLGVVTESSQNASWTWQAWPMGIHTMFARATATDGQVGQSQTVIVNVLAGDGLMEIPAEEGQTLEQIGAGFGVPPDQMTGANPNVNPTLPLTDGQTVQVPVGEGGAGNGSGQGNGGTSNPFLISIIWDIKLTEAVDKSYCYTSSGNGVWDKMPKNPFNFFQSMDNQITQFLPQQTTIIQVQCWGWLGGLLKFLGQGETKFDVLQPPDELMINGDGFVLVGMPHFPVKPEKFTGGGGLLTIPPPPYALREAKSYAECDSHGISATPCGIFWTSQVTQYVLLIWEWQSEICWPGYCKYGINEIDGYYLYEIDQLTNTQKYMKEVNNPNQKAALLPLPWGYRCYGVKAYVEGPEYGGQIVSEMATYCPGEPPAAQMIAMSPTDWLTTGGQWIKSGDCDTYGTADAYLLANKNNGFGNNPEVLVGSYIVDDEDEDCYREGNYSGGVKFSSPVLPPGAVVQKAILKFSQLFTDYSASGVATNYKLFCVSGVGKAKQDWTGLNGGNHFVGKNVLFSSAYNSPITSLSGWDTTPEVDVTSAVTNWIKYPQQNHGFILNPAQALYPAVDGHGSCESGVGNFQLEIYYFAP